MLQGFSARRNVKRKSRGSLRSLNVPVSCRQDAAYVILSGLIFLISFPLPAKHCQRATEFSISCTSLLNWVCRHLQGFREELPAHSSKGNQQGLDSIRGGILAPTRMSRRNFQMLGKVRSLKLSILIGVLAALALAGQCYGQSQAITASLSGTVLDSSGQSVNGAKLTLVSKDRGISRTYLTTDNGLYSFTLLPPATYTLQVEAAGFKHYKQDGIELIPGQNAEEKISLSLGAVTESVEVTSQAPLMNS